MHFGNFKESAERKKIKQKKGSFFRPLHHTAIRKTPGGKTICSLIRKGDEIGKTHTVKKDRVEWISVSETHQGIMTREEFGRAQEQMRKFVKCGCEDRSAKSN